MLRRSAGRLPPLPSARYGAYATAVLMIAYIFSFLDRQILTLMVGPIERSLHIKDTQFALLTGGAFGIFYTLMGLPLGWMADRFSRKWIVSIGVALWSLMTAGCGLAQSFATLLLARIGVGVGEASLTPAAYSMLSDYFDRSRLPRAMSVFACGIFIGAGLAMVLGGTVVGAVARTPVIHLAFLGATRSWQIVFIVVGLPGLALAAWLSTLREPVRRDQGLVAAAGRHKPAREALGELMGFLARYKWMFTSLYVGAALYSIIAFGDSWYPELFIRTWGWTPRHAGSVIGAATLTTGPLGMLFAGWYSSRLIAAGKVDACLWLMGLGALGITIPAIMLPLSPGPTVASLLLVPFKFFQGFAPVLVPAAIVMASPNKFRGQLGALFPFSSGIVGVTFGPIIPALVSDYVFKDPHALRYALSLSMGLMGPVTFAVSWIGLRQYRQCFHHLTRQEGGADGNLESNPSLEPG
jgi:MFS family permease